MRIAVGHKARSGKDTFADYFARKYTGKKLQFAKPLYNITNRIQAYYGLSEEKDTGLLQLVGNSARDECGDDIWLNALLANLPPTGNVVVTDLRYRNEFCKLRELGFVLVKINRTDRQNDRDQNHVSETDLDGMEFDYEIENNGSLEDFYGKIDALISFIGDSVV